MLAANGDVSAAVTTRDTAGNATTANTNHTYGVDTVAPVASISIDNVTSDNVINATESVRRLPSPVRLAMKSKRAMQLPSKSVLKPTDDG
ncbi:hypothetical protein [Pectobacterium parvum]|uniref:hypothetical protein n=1 Tax=Pectobacterium parvum TaxID=2778550 RepID=UPI001FD8915C|nr:hypothetical protein [Pectobacterium parvum]